MAEKKESIIPFIFFLAVLLIGMVVLVKYIIM
jgi:hypothetical protein